MRFKSKPSSFFFLLLILTIGTCVRFKIDNLKPELVASIKIGDKSQKIQAKLQQNVLVNLPEMPIVNLNRVYLAENANSRVKVFDLNGKLDFYIGAPDPKEEEKVKVLNFRLSYPGFVTVSEEDEIFIQNRVEVNSPSEKPQHEDYHSRFSGDFKPRETVYVPSYILHFKKNGDLSAMLGVFGKNSEPFRYIESMEARSDFLFVCHRFAEQLILTKFENDEWKGEINESNLIVLSSEETADYKVSLEKIIPHPSGEYAFVALIYTGKKDDRFKFKRIYKYNYNSPTPETLIKETQDPSESLFGFGPGEDFYIWETEDSEKSIKLKVHDREGNHYNNLRLKFPLPRVQWRETYIGPRNQIFSTRVRGDALEVYEWK